MIILSVVVGLIGLVWASRHLVISRVQRTEQPLSEGMFDGPPQPAPRVSVLVAAKDEEAVIDTCVRTLLEQDYPDFEVIAINDRSEDATRAILDKLAAEHPERFSAIHVETLSEGWFGKNNAMHTGIAQATGDWFLLTDADCRQISQRTISLAMRFALDNNVDFLSVLPVLETHSFWERVMQPVCAAIMAFWFQPSKVNDPKSSAAYANGAFMLLSRKVYNAIGGHERVRTEVNEDMHMARLTKEGRHRLFVLQNDDLYRTRMYATFGEIWRGWSRIFYGCFGSARRLFVSIGLLCVVSLMPYVTMIVGTIGWATGAAGSWSMLACCSIGTIVIQMTVLVRFYALSRSNPVLAPTYPLGAIIALGMLINAVFKIYGQATTWRGTTYRGTERVATRNGS